MYSLKKCAIHYLTGAFIVDLLASFPYFIIPMSLSDKVIVYLLSKMLQIYRYTYFMCTILSITNDKLLLQALPFLQLSQKGDTLQ